MFLKNPIEFEHFDTINSTNSYALTSTPKPNTLHVISASMQTNGRGTRKKSWLSPKGRNLYASVYFTQTDVIKCRPELLTHLMSVSIVKTLKQMLGVEISLRWPNDLMINDKKFGGLLTEINSSSEVVVIGIGINIDTNPQELKKLDQKATSLESEIDKVIDEKKLLSQIANEFNSDLDVFTKEGFAPFFEIYQKHMGFLNLPVYQEGELIGKSASVNPDGSLSITDPEGKIMSITSGSIRSF